MSTYNEYKEVNEAINAGNEALYHLEQAKDLLNSAGNWGIIDIFGGGFASTFIKDQR